MRDYLCRTIGLALPALAVVIIIAGWAHAGDRCCAHCGCTAACQKVCRLVGEEKKVETICWGCNICGQEDDTNHTTTGENKKCPHDRSRGKPF